MAPGDLEGDDADLPRPTRRSERLLDAARPAGRRRGWPRAGARGRRGSSAPDRRRGSAARRSPPRGTAPGRRTMRPPGRPARPSRTTASRPSRCRRPRTGSRPRAPRTCRPAGARRRSCAGERSTARGCGSGRSRAADFMGLSRKIPLDPTACHISARVRMPSTEGSAATKAPLRAPMLVPTTRSGRTPCSARARSIPTWVVPSTPPPPSTNAVVVMPAAYAATTAGADAAQLGWCHARRRVLRP